MVRICACSMIRRFARTPPGFVPARAMQSSSKSPSRTACVELEVRRVRGALEQASPASCAARMNLGEKRPMKMSAASSSVNGRSSAGLARERVELGDQRVRQRRRRERVERELAEPHERVARRRRCRRAEARDRVHPRQLVDGDLVLEVEQQQRAAAPERLVVGGHQRGQALVAGRRARPSRPRSAGRARRSTSADGHDAALDQRLRRRRRARARPRRGSQFGIGVPSSVGRAGRRSSSMPRSGGSAAIRCTTTRASAWCVGWSSDARLHGAQRGVLGGTGRAALGQHRVDGMLEQPAPLAAGAARGRRRSARSAGSRGSPWRRRCFVGAPVGERERRRSAPAARARACASPPGSARRRGRRRRSGASARAARRRTGSRPPAPRASSPRARWACARASVVVVSPAVRRQTIVGRRRVGLGRAWGAGAAGPACGASSSTSRSAAASSPCAAEPGHGQQRRLLGQPDAVGARGQQAVELVEALLGQRPRERGLAAR